MPNNRYPPNSRLGIHAEFGQPLAFNLHDSLNVLRRSSILLVLICLDVRADLLGRCFIHLNQIAKKPVALTLHSNLQHRTISLKYRDTNGDRVNATLELGKRVNFGGNASIYDLKSYGGFALERNADSIVAKIPHVPRIFGRAIKTIFAYRIEMDRELKGYDYLFENFDVVRDTAKQLREDFSYSRPPVLPILSRLDLDFGHIIVKDRLFLPEASPQKDDVLQSLRDIHATAQAMYETSGMALDIDPSNLAWLSNPKDLELFGLKHPSFLLYESGLVGFDLPVFLAPRMSTDQYVRHAFRRIRKKLSLR